MKKDKFILDSPIVPDATSQRVNGVEKINFVVNEGERVGVVGANGCGKSTLLKILAGQVEADDVGDKIDELAESPWFRGIRAGAEDHPENDAWLALDAVRRGIRTVLERGHVVELLVKSAHLPCVPQIARENEGEIVPPEDMTS